MKKEYRTWIIFTSVGGVLAAAATFTPGADSGQIAALSGIAVAVATLILAIVTASAIDETRSQARLAQRALYRPWLVPLMVPNSAVFKEDLPIDIHVGNTGRGTAFNITAILTRAVGADGAARAYLSAVLSVSVAVGEKEYLRFQIRERALPSEAEIGGTPLAVPTGNGRARLTVTYSDIFGTQYGSIYDLNESLAWVPVATPEDIARSASDVSAI